MWRFLLNQEFHSEPRPVGPCLNVSCLNPDEASLSPSHPEKNPGNNPVPRQAPPNLLSTHKNHNPFVIVVDNKIVAASKYTHRRRVKNPLIVK